MRKLLISTLVSGDAGRGGSRPKNGQARRRAGSGHHAPQPKPDEQSDVQGAQLIEEQLRTQLKGARFTDIEVMPMSFAVRAKDADGNPVFLMLSPDGVWQLTPQNGQDESPTSFPDQGRF